MAGAVVAAIVAGGFEAGIVQDGVQVCPGEPREVQVAVCTGRADCVQLAVGGV